MCYTRSFQWEATEITVHISNCYGVGFLWDDPALIDAVRNRDERIWEILDWIALGGAAEANEAFSFEEQLDNHRSYQGALRFFNRCEPDELTALLDNEYVKPFTRGLIGSYRNGALQVGADMEKAQEKAAKTKKVKTNPGYVYLIWAENGLYKIGKAKKLNERMKPFTVNFPMKWELVHSFPADDYSVAEAELHAKYADKQEVGEWFALSSGDAAYIKTLTDYRNGEFIQ